MPEKKPQITQFVILKTSAIMRVLGEVPEWTIGAVSKTVVVFGPPWVRIPPSPLLDFRLLIVDFELVDRVQIAVGYGVWTAVPTQAVGRQTTSCDNTRRWATNYVACQNNSVRAILRFKGGYHTYRPVMGWAWKSRCKVGWRFRTAANKFMTKYYRIVRNKN